MTQPSTPQEAEVTREHREAALRAQGFGTRWRPIPPDSAMARWLEHGEYPGDRLMGSDMIAQALANAEARGRASRESELTTLREQSQMERAVVEAAVAFEKRVACGDGSWPAVCPLVDAVDALLAHRAQKGT